MTSAQGQSTMPPLGILLELTHRCPLQCPYCSNPLELVRASHELDTATWQRVIHEAAQMGVLQVHLSGGEPAARKDLEDIVAACSAAGLYSNLITSGLLIDAERLRRLADAGLDHVQLSLQDVEEKNADRIANYPSAFRRKLEFAGHVSQVGLPLTLNAVIHRQNIGNLEAMIALAEKLGAGRLEVAHVQYYGWALANRDALLPTRADVTRTTEIVEAARARLKGTLVIDYVTPDYYGSRPKACMGGWGRQVMVITPQGEAWPCHAAKIIPGMSFENVSTRSLPDIWTKSDAFMRFRGTDWMPDPCKSCDRREIDWGGCRCQAQALLGDAALTDPVCELSASHAALAKIADASASAPVPAFRYRRIGG